MKKFYKYTLKEDLEFELFYMPWHICLTNRWVEIEGRKITVKKGYSWDGCSPKFKIGNIVLGSWDGPVNSKGDQACKYPSLIHDVLYQFKRQLEHQGVSRKLIDNEFKMMMKAARFKLYKPYYWAVRLFGGLFSKFY